MAKSSNTTWTKSYCPNFRCHNEALYYSNSEYSKISRQISFIFYLNTFILFQISVFIVVPYTFYIPSTKYLKMYCLQVRNIVTFSSSLCAYGVFDKIEAYINNSFDNKTTSFNSQILTSKLY